MQKYALNQVSELINCTPKDNQSFSDILKRYCLKKGKHEFGQIGRTKNDERFFHQLLNRKKTPNSIEKKKRKNQILLICNVLMPKKLNCFRLSIDSYFVLEKNHLNRFNEQIKNKQTNQS